MAWTAPSDRSVGELITATIWNEHMGAAGNEKFLLDAQGNCTQKTNDEADFAPARAIDTVYQNTGTTLLMVSVSFTLTDGDEVGICVDSDNTPSATVATISNGTGAAALKSAVTFMVPAGWYYKAVTITGAVPVIEWAEWQLFV